MRPSAPAILGYNEPSVDQAVADTSTARVGDGVGVTNTEIDLAEKLVDIIPSYEQVLLTVRDQKHLVTRVGWQGLRLDAG